MMPAPAIVVTMTAADRLVGRRGARWRAGATRPRAADRAGGAYPEPLFARWDDTHILLDDVAT